MRPEHHDSRARSGITESRENSLPDPSEIRSNDDFNRAFFSTQEGVNRFRKQFGPNGLQKARAMYPDVNRGVYLLNISVIPLNLNVISYHAGQLSKSAKFYYWLG